LVGSLSPARRRWLRFLRELPLDADALPDPVEPPAEHDFIICGCPRTGTTLLTAALFQPPTVVTVMEPWDGMRLAPGPLFASLRGEIEQTGRIARGRLDLERLGTDGAALWIREGEHPAEVEVGPGWQLGVKWPGYWRYLDRLPATRFVVCLRHPAEVIASLKALQGPGRVGLQFGTRFNKGLNDALLAATDDPALRRVLLYDHVHERLLPHLEREEVHVVRYEDWFDAPSRTLDALGAFLGADVSAPPVRVRASTGGAALDDRDRALLREHCRTAAALGYDLA
jgi:hypothetical protein